MALVDPTHDAKIVMSHAIVARLAGKICDLDKTTLTKQALAQAKICILDTIGVTLAGVPEPCTQILLRTPGVATAPGPSLIFGTDRRTSALDATLVNGTASRALDLDDLGDTLGGLQSVPLVPMLFALAEERRGRGDDLIAAYVIGTETEMRLARAVDHDKGWHPASALGTLAAAAAASHFLKLGQERTATALAIAASLASGIKANLGAMTKPLHAGQCGRNGLLAALLAEQGFDAAADVFEHHQGFLNVCDGQGTFDVERLFADWAAPPEIEAATIVRGGDHPMGASELWDKFEDRAARALPREQIASLFERLETLDKVIDMSQATRLLQTSGLHQPQAKKVVFAARGAHEPEETSWVP
jgi:2-methylcitrate dehydratase PrpD